MSIQWGSCPSCGTGTANGSTCGDCADAAGSSAEKKEGCLPAVACAVVLIVLAIAAFLVTSCAPSGVGYDQIDLSVVPEPAERFGYDRDLFGGYDRDALLDQNWAAYPDCGGYYSAADDQCHAGADAVEVDHVVPLAEAWDSGAATWALAYLPAFGAEAENLWLMTAGLNRSKGDQDPAEWLPPYAAATCGYLQAYVAVKAEWELTVDEAELAALTGSGCELSTP